MTKIGRTSPEPTPVLLIWKSADPPTRSAGSLTQRAGRAGNWSRKPVYSSPETDQFVIHFRPRSQLIGHNSSCDRDTHILISTGFEPWEFNYSLFFPLSPGNEESQNFSFRIFPRGWTITIADRDDETFIECYGIVPQISGAQAEV